MIVWLHSLFFSLMWCFWVKTFYEVFLFIFTVAVDFAMYHVPSARSVMYPPLGVWCTLRSGCGSTPRSGCGSTPRSGCGTTPRSVQRYCPARCRGTALLGAEVLPCSVQRYCPARIRGANLTLCIRSEVEPDLRDGGEHVKNIFWQWRNFVRIEFNL